MPTASLMTYVMGLEAAKTRLATDEERAEMARLLDEGMDAGLCGFSIQRLGRNSGQADFDGSPMVTDTMCDEDILNLARVLRARDEGFIEITQAHRPRQAATSRFVEELAGTAQRPILFQAVVAEPARIPRSIAAVCAGSSECARQGSADLRPGRDRPQRLRLHPRTLEPVRRQPGMARRCTTGTTEEKIAKMKDPATARRPCSRATRPMRALDSNARRHRRRLPKHLIVQWVENSPNSRSTSASRSAKSAQEEGKHPVDVMLDLSLATDLKAEFLGPSSGFNADYMAEIINDSPFTFPGVSDGGAHTKFFTGGAFTTDFLRWMVRDEQKVTLEEAHYRLSALPAHAAGFKRSRHPARRRAADVVVYDLKGLDVEPDWVGEVAHDLPGRRMAPRAARQGLPLDHRQRRTRPSPRASALARRRASSCATATPD